MLVLYTSLLQFVFNRKDEMEENVRREIDSAENT